MRANAIKKVGGYIILLSVLVMPLLKYNSLHTAIFDSGLHLSLLFDMSKFNELGGVAFVHFRPYLLLFSKLHNIFGYKFSPYIIYFLQGVLIVLPFYLIGKKFGKIVFIAGFLFFPLWFNLLFDFHIDHLSILFTTLFFVLVQSNRMGLAAFFAVALALVKEPFALQTAMCGVYMLGVHWKNNYHAVGGDLFNSRSIKVHLYSTILFAFGLGYFYIVTNYIIPLYSGGEQFVSLKSESFSWLGSGMGEMFLYILTHPVEIMVEIFTTPGKMIYLVALFGALGFIPLLKPGPLIVALPILAISLLSQHEGYYGLGHHYTAGLIAPMIFAFAGGLPRAKMIWQKIGFGSFRLQVKWFIPVLVTGLIAAHIALAPSPIGRLFWSDKVWSYNYQAYIPTERDAMIKQAIDNFIPADPDVVVSIQNTINWGPLVQRRYSLLFPQGVTERQQVPFFGKGLYPPDVKWKSVMADFVVLDLKRPWFLLDKGCEWLYGKCTDEKMTAEYLDWVVKSRKVMEIVFEKDGFLILKSS